MKKLYIILLFGFSLLALCLSLALMSVYFYIPFVGDFVEYLSLYLWMDAIFAGFILFLSVCFLSILVASILFFNKREDLVFFGVKGKLLVSRQTIESTASYSFADVFGISFSRVIARGRGNHPENIKIFVKLSINDSSELVVLTETVQDKIRAALESSLGITPKAVNVRISEFKPNSQSSFNGRIV